MALLMTPTRRQLRIQKKHARSTDRNWMPRLKDATYSHHFSPIKNHPGSRSHLHKEGSLNDIGRGAGFPNWFLRTSRKTWKKNRTENIREGARDGWWDGPDMRYRPLGSKSKYMRWLVSTRRFIVKRTRPGFRRSQHQMSGSFRPPLYSTEIRAKKKTNKRSHLSAFRKHARHFSFRCHFYFWKFLFKKKRKFATALEATSRQILRSAVEIDLTLTLAYNFQLSWCLLRISKIYRPSVVILCSWKMKSSY